MKTYKEIPSCIINKKEFIGNSCRAIRRNNIYEVYSYETIIYSDEGYFSNRYYSSTTSKLQNIIIEAYGLNGGITKRD